MTALVLGGIAWSALASAASLPIPGARAFGPPRARVEQIGYWKRYCTFNNCTGPNVVVVQPTAPAVVATTPPVVATENPPIVAIVPVRPVSCGEFHYWNGLACVDARYNNPYLGPR
ncbi:MAG: hypothetical protein ACM3MH_07345 [Actinomycetota bacterium]